MRSLEFRIWYCNMMQYPNIQDVFIGRANQITMQYTGLKDHNGVKIFEKDILSNKDTDGYMVVNWCPISAGFCLDKNGWMFSHYFKEAVDADQCEIVGNVFEHPHLLNKDVKKESL